MTGNSDFTPAAVPSGRLTIADKVYLADAKGALVPEELIRPQHLLEDETVRKIIGFGLALSEQVTRFKAHTFTDLGDFDALLEQEYNLKKGGRKGNRTYTSFDGLMKVEVRVADLLDFGPELQIAKGLVDECLNEWSADARPEIRAIVTRAFNTDMEGQINRSEIFMLLRLQIEDQRWQSAMDAVRDAMRTVGSKTYIRLSIRNRFKAGWDTLSINLPAA